MQKHVKHLTVAGAKMPRKGILCAYVTGHGVNSSPAITTKQNDISDQIEIMNVLLYNRL